MDQCKKSRRKANEIPVQKKILRSFSRKHNKDRVAKKQKIFREGNYTEDQYKTLDITMIDIWKCEGQALRKTSLRTKLN